MRNFVADSLTEDLFYLYQMFAAAGVEDFAWLLHHRSPRTLEEWKDAARVSGRHAGAGHCVWADEHAIRTVAAAADVCLLIIDEQAATRGSRSGKRRGADIGLADGRFVMIGEPRPQCVLLHRSRRQHFTPLFYRGSGVIQVDSLPAVTRQLWPKLECSPEGKRPRPTR